MREVKSFKHIKQLNDKIFPGEPYERHPFGFYWLVYFNKRPVGFCGMHICASTNEWDTVFFSRAGVIKTHRGKGIGQRLLKVRLKAAKELEMRNVITYTIDNVPSSNNLIKAGFKLFDPHYPFGGEGALHWIKELK